MTSVDRPTTGVTGDDNEDRSRPGPGPRAGAAAASGRQTPTGRTGPGVDGGLLSPPTRHREAVLVAVVLGIQVLGATVAAARPEYDAPGVANYLLVAMGAVALPLRHRYPLAVLAVTFLSAEIYWAQDVPRGPVFVAWLVAATHVMLIGRRLVALATLVVGFALFSTVGYLLGNAEPPTMASLFFSMAWMSTLIAVTEAVRIRRDRALERVRSEAEALKRRVADERMRMARDLHDAVAHNMSLISIQAGVALHLLESDRADTTGGADRAEATTDRRPDLPDQVGDALTTIRDASKEALVELRSVLGVLRQVDETADADAAPLSPAPGLARLDELVTRAGSAGVAVRVDARPADRPVEELPRPVDQAAFRIIQESLTNVSRHSGAGAALVRIRLRDGELRLEILDEGTGSTPGPSDLPDGGNGIVGMRERAAAVGGRLRAEPRPGGGFAVRAELPLGNEDRDLARDNPADPDEGSRTGPGALSRPEAP